MRKKLILLFVLIGATTVFAEVEFALGVGHGTSGTFFNAQLGWKQIYNHSIISTVDFSTGGQPYTFNNLDVNTAYYHKRFAFGAGVGKQWSQGAGHPYVKPNISYNFKYAKFTVESRIFFDKSADISFSINLRNFGALIALFVFGAPQVHDTYTVRSHGYGYYTVTHTQVTEADRERYFRNAADTIMGIPEWWGDINLNGGAYK